MRLQPGVQAVEVEGWQRSLGLQGQPSPAAYVIEYTQLTHHVLGAKLEGAELCHSLKSLWSALVLIITLELSKSWKVGGAMATALPVKSHPAAEPLAWTGEHWEDPVERPLEPLVTGGLPGALSAPESTPLEQEGGGQVLPRSCNLHASPPRPPWVPNTGHWDTSLAGIPASPAVPEQLRRCAGAVVRRCGGWALQQPAPGWGLQDAQPIKMGMGVQEMLYPKICLGEAC